MTSRDPIIYKTANEIIEQFEERGDKVILLDGVVPIAFSTRILNERQYVTALLVLKDCLTRKGVIKWRAKEQIKELLTIGYDKITLVAVDSKTNRKRIVHLNKQGRMAN